MEQVFHERLSSMERQFRKMMRIVVNHNKNDHAYQITMSDLAEQIQSLDTKLVYVDGRLSDLFGLCGFPDKAPRRANKWTQISEEPSSLENVSPDSLLTERVRKRDPDDMDDANSDDDDTEQTYGSSKEMTQVKEDLQRLTTNVSLRLGMVEQVMQLRSDKHFLPDYSDTLDVEGYYFADELNRRTNKNQPAPEHWSKYNPSNLARMAFNLPQLQPSQQVIPYQPDRFLQNENVFVTHSPPAAVPVSLTPFTHAPRPMGPTGGDFEDAMDLDWHFPVPGKKSFFLVLCALSFFHLCQSSRFPLVSTVVNRNVAPENLPSERYTRINLETS